MSNIIKFVKPKNKDNKGEFMFDLSVFSYGEETSAFFNEFGDQFDGVKEAEAYRMVADRLDGLSFMMRAGAEVEEESEIGVAIAVVTIFAGGGVHLRMDSNRVVSQEHKGWVREQLEAAKTDARLQP